MTVREQFEQVKEPWGKEAIEEAASFLLGSESSGLKEDLVTVILWDTSLHGRDYWQNIYNSLND